MVSPSISYLMPLTFNFTKVCASAAYCERGDISFVLLARLKHVVNAVKSLTYQLNITRAIKTCYKRGEIINLSVSYYSRD